MQERHQRLIQRVAWTGALLMLLVTTSSAYLRLRAAGLGCVDWPQCYGNMASNAHSLDEAWIAGARVVHRFSASIAGALALLILVIANHSRPVHRRTLFLAGVLLAVAVGLALLGRVTPQARMPAVALGNLLGGMGMSALFVALAVTHSWIQGKSVSPTYSALALLLLCVQLASGALTSATFSGMACTTFPDCSGLWWPQGSAVSDFNPWQIAPPGETLSSASLHMAHRYLALCVIVVLIGLSIALMCYRGVSRGLGISLLILALSQVAIGITLLAHSLPMVFALSHNIVASLLLSTLTMVVSVSYGAR